MKKYFAGLGIIMLLWMTACAQQKKTTTTAVSSKTPQLTYMKMQRTPCFGRCPTYAIEVYNNGLVRWSGYNFTEHQGIYEKNIGAKAAMNYLGQFAAYRPDTCQDSYNVPITDIPGLHYTIRMNGDDKEIANAHYGPRFLKDFAITMDKAFKVDGSWKKVADTATRR